MEIEKSVVEFATEAALRYRAIAQLRHDNEVPESFLRSHVASRLHDRFDCPVHVDRLYAAMAIDLGGPVTADLVTALGGHRADIAIYRDGRPVAVIELKVFDEVAPLPAIGVKLDKAKILARVAPLQIFLGAMICPIVLSLEARIERLHDAVRATCSSANANRRATVGGIGALPALRSAKSGQTFDWLSAVALDHERP